MEKATKKEIPTDVQDKLEKKRFLLPKDPEITDRLNKIREIYQEAKNNFPEIISFQLFGSVVKGYGNSESDFDYWIVVDRNIALEIARKKMKEEKQPVEQDEVIRLLAHEDRRLGVITNVIRGALAHEFSITDLKKYLKHVKYFCISDDIIREYISSPESPIEVLSHLFLLTVGDSKKIRDWRKIIFDELEKQGESGEEKWRRIAENMWGFERYGHNEEKINPKIYPLTIHDARKRFT